MIPVAPLSRILAGLIDRVETRGMPEPERTRYLRHASSKRLRSGLFAIMFLIALAIAFLILAERSYDEEMKALDTSLKKASLNTHVIAPRANPQPMKSVSAYIALLAAEYPRCWDASMLEHCPKATNNREEVARAVRKRLLPSCTFSRPEKTDFCRYVIDRIALCYESESKECLELWGDIHEARRAR
jgi:hypothetical protein